MMRAVVALWWAGGGLILLILLFSEPESVPLGELALFVIGGVIITMILWRIGGSFMSQENE